MARSTFESLLWVAPRWPSPADDGAKIAMERIMRPLSVSGERLHLLSVVTPWDPPKKPIHFEVASLRVDHRGSTSRFFTRAMSALASLLAGGLPYSVRPFASHGLRIRTARWLENLPLSSPIVIDGLHVAAALDLKTSTRWVYRAHNVEWRILNDAAVLSRGPKKIFLDLQAALLKKFEARIIARSRVSLAVSEADAAEMRKLAPDARIEVLPIGADFSKEPDFSLQPSSHVKLLFVGRLDWEPNRDGLLWFLDNIWTRLDKHRFELAIVGSGNSSYLEKWRGSAGLHLHGAVESLGPYYAEAHVCLVPLRWASGTRVKIIEAIQVGRAVLSTAAGALGIELSSGELCLAENPDEWIEVLNKRSPSDWEEQSRRAWQGAASTYGESQLAERFMEFLK